MNWPECSSKMEDYQKPLKDLYGEQACFFLPPPTENRDWNTLNDIGVFTGAKKAFQVQEKYSRIEIRVGHYYGLYDASFDMQADSGITKTSFTGCGSAPGVKWAIVNGFTTEEDAIKHILPRAIEWWLQNARTDNRLWREFDAYQKELFCPQPKQLTLF